MNLRRNRVDCQQCVPQQEASSNAPHSTTATSGFPCVGTTRYRGTLLIRNSSLQGYLAHKKL